MHSTGHVLSFERWRTFRSLLLWAYEKTFEHFDKTYLPSPIAAWRVLEGEIELTAADGSREVYPQGYWVFPRAVAGHLHFSPKTRIVSIRFRAEWFHGVSIFSRKRTLLIPAEGSSLNPAAAALVEYIRDLSGADALGAPLGGDFREFLRLAPPFGQWLIAYFDTMEAEGEKFQSLADLTDTVCLALEFMEHRSFSRPLRVAEVAAHVGVSVSQLNKLFMQNTGKTPAVIWNLRKLARAKEELSYGAETIKAIAYQLGYSSPAQFSHWFRTNAGVAPIEFRARLRKLPHPL